MVVGTFVDDQTLAVALSLAPTKPDGSPGTVDGAPIWGVPNPDTGELDPIDPAAGELVVAPDGLSARFNYAAVTGTDPVTTSFSVRADGDLTPEGVATVQEDFVITIAPQGASALNGSLVAVPRV